MAEKIENPVFKLPNVRLSFPSLFQSAKFAGAETGKYEATFYLDKTEHAALIAEIEAAIKSMIAANKFNKLSPDKICLRDGADSGREGMEGVMTLKASTKKRPLVIDFDKTPIVEDDNKIYAGCYVNAIVSLWPQNNEFGKRINGSLSGVQFRADGEPFATGGADVGDFDVFDEF